MKSRCFQTLFWCDVKLNFYETKNKIIIIIIIVLKVLLVVFTKFTVSLEKF